MNFRPEYHADWMSKSFYRQLPLLPLGREATAELVADLLGRDPSLANLSERIHEHTRGNPFFVEELAQSLVESGSLAGSRGAYRLIAPVERLELPATVQAVLAARIDRLPEREKRLLQTASVIGKEVPEPVLRRVAELPVADLSGALATLVQAELLVEKALYPEAEYAFKHPLTHAVAYESQLSQPRARTHAAVASALEEIEASRLDERSALLAHHWDEAGDATRGARWHARAARWCALDNVPEAYRHWSHVWTLPVGVEEPDELVALRLAAAIEILQGGAFMGTDEASGRAILARGLELATQQADLRSRVLLLISFAGIFGPSGELFAGRNELEAAFELAARSGDPELRFTVHEEMIDRLQFTGRLAEAAALGNAYVEHGHGLERAVVRYLPVAWSIARRAWVWIELGRLDAAADSLRECAERLRESGSKESESWTELLRAKCRLLAGDLDAARMHAQRGSEMAEQRGSTLSRVWAHAQLGAVFAAAREWKPAVEHLEQALGTSRETRVWLTLESEFLADVAEAQLGRGDAEQAQRTAEEAIETGRRRQTPVFEARAYLALARVLLARFGAGARDEIERALASCLSLVERTEARVYEPHVHELRAELAGLLGDEAEAARERREAQRLFIAIDAPAHAERLDRALSR